MDLFERDIVEYKLDEFKTLNIEFDEEIEYIVYNTHGGDFKITTDGNTCDILYMETHYTKYWEMNISLEKYMDIKYNQFKNLSYDAELNTDDECHPVVYISITTDPGSVKDEMFKIESINNKLDNDMNELEKQITNLIDNYKFN